MKHEIKIYGEIVPFQGTQIENRGYTNLSIVEEQLKNADGSELLVRLHTVGGDVDEGFAMYASLRRYAKENNVKITTRADGQVASIGTVIFLAGDERVGSPYIQPFFHKAQSLLGGDNEQIKKGLALNEEANKRISLHYSQHTNLTEQEAMELMNGETFLPPQDAEELRFTTTTEEIMRPKALLRKKITNNNMNSKSKNKKGLFQEIKNLIGIYSGEGNTNKIVYTAEMNELDFYQLDENEAPSIGDKATFDGKPAGESNKGEYILQGGETYKFTGEELTEIIPKEESVSDLQLENENLKKQIEDLKKQNSGLQSENKKQEETITGQNIKIETANTLIAKFNSWEIDEENENEEAEKPRNHRQNFSDVPVRNLFQNIK
ncbi:Clp protease ClpP [Chryseobacterium potabilaquae]|uniref:ATP-dependent Clp protease proteolytic subunit n=1 Tax=Chryseobacterium potabilaquae TaxID=2675057 RepID=A0A6N4X845_9FLAO|nr:ATP-dependent Clp protease proteolytic subunit [Chryseobacterium potabilaquae]CAA7195449.1 ATP-dependent Clp protease proteolytic subunit [Chryseobacterium potabilaquae]